MSDYLDPNNEELLKDFYVEAEMQLESLERNILVLESDSSNEDAVDEIFRAAHTLKGAAATVQMMELAEFTHVVEDALDEIRGGKVKVDGHTVDVLLESLDIVKSMLESRSEGSVYAGDVSTVKDQLRELFKGSEASKGVLLKTPKTIESPANQSSHIQKSGTFSISEYEILELKEAAGAEEEIFAVRVTFDPDNPMNSVGGIQVFATLKTVGTILKTDPDFEKLYEDAFYPEVVYFLSGNTAKEIIEEKAFISDVTLEVEVLELVQGKGSVVSNTKVESSKESEKSSEKSIDDLVASITGEIHQKGKEASIDLKDLEPRPQASHEPEPDPVPLGEDEAKNDEPRVPEERIEGTKKAQNAGGSVLRVESKRIDDLLNLVSETVINKATFNQVSNQFTENMNHLAQVQGSYRQLVKELFDSLPDFMEKIERGVSVKDVKKEITEGYGELLTMFDGIQSSFKGSINKFRSTAQNLGRITSELQEGVMRIRMVPIAQIFSRFPRLVRDLSKSLDKQIKLQIEGEDTELDKSVIEDLLDPLIHCVRNSLDHGIESPKERMAAGKSVEGTLLLKASNEGNMILIEIYDDGKGIDVDKVKQKAIERGIIHPNKVLTDVEAYNLIFEPGFSTAAQVTNISGRGVGLDVVRKQIEKLNGHVSVVSTPGKGSRFTIKIPLTLAIIQGLLVRVGQELYAIPITAVLDSHRIKPQEIRRIDNYEVFNVREDVVSLMRLDRIFNIPTDEKREHYFVVIVGSGDKKMGLIVDQLIGEEDVVIKPLRDHYTNAPGIAGANITGDGTVSLIIDVSQLLELGQMQEREARLKREETSSRK